MLHTHTRDDLDLDCTVVVAVADADRNASELVQFPYSTQTSSCHLQIRKFM